MIRIHHLARNLNMRSIDLIRALRRMGFNIPSASTALPLTLADMITERHDRGMLI